MAEREESGNMEKKTVSSGRREEVWEKKSEEEDSEMSSVNENGERFAIVLASGGHRLTSTAGD